MAELRAETPAVRLWTLKFFHLLRIKINCRIR